MSVKQALTPHSVLLRSIQIVGPWIVPGEGREVSSAQHRVCEKLLRGKCMTASKPLA